MEDVEKDNYKFQNCNDAVILSVILIIVILYSKDPLKNKRVDSDSSRKNLNCLTNKIKSMFSQEYQLNDI